MTTDSPATLREQAKLDLKQALKQHQGDTQAEPVTQAIACLASLNPNPNPRDNPSLLEGNWLLINAPNFPGKLQDPESKFVYTLGRLAFNKFTPANLKIAIARVFQPVLAAETSNCYSYDIIVDFDIVDRDYLQLQGTIKNLAVCSFVDRDTVQVEFTGAELFPRETTQIDLWLNIFGEDNRTSPMPLLERLQLWLVQKMFGIGEVSPIDRHTGKRYFAIDRSPKGKLKLLYLDDELRITQGKRESILVCQKVNN